MSSSSGSRNLSRSSSNSGVKVILNHNKRKINKLEKKIDTLEKEIKNLHSQNEEFSEYLINILDRLEDAGIVKEKE